GHARALGYRGFAPVASVPVARVARGVDVVAAGSSGAGVDVVLGAGAECADFRDAVSGCGAWGCELLDLLAQPRADRGGCGVRRGGAGVSAELAGLSAGGGARGG